MSVEVIKIVGAIVVTIIIVIGATASESKCPPKKRKVHVGFSGFGADYEAEY